MMKTQEKINQLVYNTVVAAIKDTTIDSVVKASSLKQIKLSNEQLAGLITIIEQAIVAGYHRSNSTFLKELESIVKK